MLFSSPALSSFLVVARLAFRCRLLGWFLGIAGSLAAGSVCAAPADEPFSLLARAMRSRSSLVYTARQSVIIVSPRVTGGMTQIVVDIARDRRRARLTYQLPPEAAGRILADDGTRTEQFEPSLQARLLGRARPPDEDAAARENMLALLRRNYSCTRVRRESVNDRLCDVVALQPRCWDGPRRLCWIDRRNHAVLRTEEYDADGCRLYVSSYDWIHFAPHIPARLLGLPPSALSAPVRPSAAPPRLVSGPDRAFIEAGLPGRTPAWLPPGYRLLSSAVWNKRAGGKAVILRLGDGLQTLTVVQEAMEAGQPDTARQQQQRNRQLARYGQQAWVTENDGLRVIATGDLTLPDSLGHDIQHALRRETEQSLARGLAATFGSEVARQGRALRRAGWGYEEIAALALSRQKHLNAALWTQARRMPWPELARRRHVNAAAWDAPARRWISATLSARPRSEHFLNLFHQENAVMTARPAALCPTVALVFSLAASAVFAQTPPAAAPPSPQQKTLLVEMQDAFTKIAKTVEPTVVNIKTERLRAGDIASLDDGNVPLPPGIAPRRPPQRPRRSQATGSGVIVRADGYILTNDHVVAGATNGLVAITLADGREFQGRVFTDPKSDLAVVKVDAGKTPLPFATFADSSLVVPGQWAIAVGSPFDLSNTLTIGIISAVGRHQQISGDAPGQGRYYPELLQTDAAINPGNSGGPLFNIDGRIVGINVAIESPVEGSAGVGFAIPSQVAQRVMEALIRDKKVTRGYLGIAPDDLTPALQELYGQKEGAFVRDVALTSPAGRAGLQAADIVISFAGHPITGETSLRTAIATTPPDTSVQIAYVRDGTRHETTAKIAPAPVEEADTPIVPPSSPTRPPLGLSVRGITAIDRARLDLPTGTQGVLIVDVAPGGAAETAIQSINPVLKDVVLQKIGQTPIRSKADFDRATAALSGPSLLTLVVLASPANQWHQSALTVRL